MTEIGIVGLDTSHAEAFASVLDEMADVTVSGVWDGNAVRSDEYVEAFCRDNRATRYDDVAALAESVDAAMVLTVDWESHVPLATTFLDAGLPTMVDKPIAGTVDDLSRLTAATQNAPLFGGSAVPFHRSFADFPRGGRGRTLYAAGFNDYFYYRVHLTDTIRFLAGQNWTRVKRAAEPGTTVDVEFENHTHATLRFDGSPDDGMFSVLDVGETTNAVAIESNRDSLAAMYHPFIESFLDVVAGERDDTDRLLDAATLQLAVEATIDTGDAITPESEALAAISVDSAPFLADYNPYY